MARLNRSRSTRGDRPGLRGLLAAMPVEPFRTAALFTLFAGLTAAQAVDSGFLPVRSAPLVQSPSPDPIVATVGALPIRVSDLRAQAGPSLGSASPDVLVRDGYLDDAAQQLLLAQAAEADGIDQALEVRAALALARRRVLSEAYLDLAVSKAVTDDAVRAAFDDELAAVRTYDRLSVRHVLTATYEDAEAAQRRLARGERFDTIASRLSLDETTRGEGGSFGMIAPDALPAALREAAMVAPVGTLVGPLQSEDGWHILRVDARRQLAVPQFEEREAEIRERLRVDAMREAAQRASRDVQIQPAPVVTLDVSNGQDERPNGQAEAVSTPDAEAPAL